MHKRNEWNKDFIINKVETRKNEKFLAWAIYDKWNNIPHYTQTEK